MSIVQQFTIWVLPVLFAITLHEVAHGFMAFRFGDPTAKILGRLSLNPLKHIDLIGTVLVPLALFFTSGFIFGWAKPVPVDWKNLRHPQRDMALVALAGPMANVFMALLWGAISKVSLFLVAQFNLPIVLLIYMGQAGISINIVLAVLNLLPVPPLDGSRVIASVLSGKWLSRYQKLEPFGFLILLVLLITGLLGILLAPAITKLTSLLTGLYGF